MEESTTIQELEANDLRPTLTDPVLEPPVVEGKGEAGASSDSGKDNGQGAAPAEDAGKAAAGGADDAKHTGDGEYGKGKESGDDTRFDKHPRFQELNERVRAAEERAIRAEATAQALGKKEEGDGKPAVPLDFDNVAEMDDDKIREMMEEDPKGFAANLLRQAKHEVKEELGTSLREERQVDEEQSAIAKTYENYAKKNPDFEEMWGRGEIQDFMRDNPGYTSIHAHQILTQETRMQDSIDKAVKEAVTKAREEERRNLSAKASAGSAMGAGPSGGGAGPPAGSAPELKDTKKFGGRTTALLARLNARRREQAAR